MEERRGERRGRNMRKQDEARWDGLLRERRDEK